MGANVNECLTCAICQPPIWEHTAPDGLFIKQMYLKDAGTMIPQHAHAYAHTSMLAKGRIHAWAEGVDLGEFTAPYPLYIPARVKHTFMSLENDTIIYCIHRSEPVIVSEHQIVGRDFSGE